MLWTKDFSSAHQRKCISRNRTMNFLLPRQLFVIYKCTYDTKINSPSFRFRQDSAQNRNNSHSSPFLFLPHVSKSRPAGQMWPAHSPHHWPIWTQLFVLLKNSLSLKMNTFLLCVRTCCSQVNTVHNLKTTVFAFSCAALKMHNAYVLQVKQEPVKRFFLFWGRIHQHRPFRCLMLGYGFEAIL